MFEFEFGIVTFGTIRLQLAPSRPFGLGSACAMQSMHGSDTRWYFG